MGTGGAVSGMVSECDRQIQYSLKNIILFALAKKTIWNGFNGGGGGAMMATNCEVDDFIFLYINSYP